MPQIYPNNNSQKRGNARLPKLFVVELQVGDKVYSAVSIYSNWAGYLKEQDKPYIEMLKNVVKYTARPLTIKRIVNRFIQGDIFVTSFYVT